MLRYASLAALLYSGMTNAFDQDDNQADKAWSKGIEQKGHYVFDLQARVHTELDVMLQHAEKFLPKKFRSQLMQIMISEVRNIIKPHVEAVLAEINDDPANPLKAGDTAEKRNKRRAWRLEKKFTVRFLFSNQRLISKMVSDFDTVLKNQNHQLVNELLAEMYQKFYTEAKVDSTSERLRNGEFFNLDITEERFQSAFVAPAKDDFSNQMMQHYEEISEVSYGEMQIYIKTWLAKKVNDKKLRDYLKAITQGRQTALDKEAKGKLIDFTLDDNFKNKKKHDDLGQQKGSLKEDMIFRKWIEIAFASSTEEHHSKAAPQDDDEAYWYEKFSKVLEELRKAQPQEKYEPSDYIAKWENGQKGAATLDYLNDLKVDEDDVEDAGEIDVEQMLVADQVLYELDQEGSVPLFLQ